MLIDLHLHTSTKWISPPIISAFLGPSIFLETV